jgi:PPOX class probable F420-dependent enzyme
VNAQEITTYLAASHIAVVATISRNGAPHLTPNWYRYDGQVLTLITRKDRLKYRNLQRHNRISVCIYDPPAASNYVVISGTATCNDQDIWDEARRIIARYRAADQVDEYLARWQTEPRVLITVTPERIATRAAGRR